jgi:hypothetical protein
MHCVASGAASVIPGGLPFPPSARRQLISENVGLVNPHTTAVISDQ